MLDPRDRRDLATLGLMVLVYGLVLAPVVHAVVDHQGAAERAHGHGHAHGDTGHTHGAPGAPDGEPGKAPEAPGHQHAPGSVEHLLAVALTQQVVLAPVRRWVALRAEVFRGPLRLPGVPARRTEMPQGP